MCRHSQKFRLSPNRFSRWHDKDPRYYHLQGHILLESYYPLPWMLGDFTRIGYYKKDEPPAPLDADFVVAEVGQMEKIEAGSPASITSGNFVCGIRRKSVSFTSQKQLSTIGSRRPSALPGTPMKFVSATLGFATMVVVSTGRFAFLRLRAQQSPSPGRSLACAHRGRDWRRG